MSVAVQSAALAPTGAQSEFSGLTFSSGSLTKIAGLHTDAGRFVSKLSNGVTGGVTQGGFTQFNPYLAWTRVTFPSYAPSQFSVFAATLAPTGAQSEFSGLTFSSGSLTKIAGLHTNAGSYLVKNGTLYQGSDGAWNLPKVGTLLLGVTSGMPAVPIPGAVPLVQILE
jgi:hypothetical protein